jgi:hypothetical protein
VPVQRVTEGSQVRLAANGPHSSRWSRPGLWVSLFLSLSLSLLPSIY